MQEPQNASQQMLYETHTQAPVASRTLLNTLHDTFARELGVQLSAYLRIGVNVRTKSVEEYDYSKFLTGQNGHSCIAVFTVQPAGWQILFELNAAVVFPLLELMLGAKPAARPIPDRALTEIEKQLVAIIMRSIGGELERVWSAAAQVSMQFRGIETPSQVTRLFPATENVIAASFDLTVGERSGILTVLSAAQPLDSLLSDSDRASLPEAGISDEVNISRNMLEADVQLDVWMTGLSMALGDLVQLREGYVIKFDHPTERQLSCTLNGVAGFGGQVVSTGRKRALLIEEDLVNSSCVSG